MKIPTSLDDRWRVGFVAGAGIAMLSVLLLRFHNGWLYFLTPPLGAIVAGIFVMVFPYAMASSERLVHRRGAQPRLLLATFLTAVVLGLVMLAIAHLRSEPLQWHVDLWKLLTMTILFGLSSNTVYLHVLIRWVGRSSNRGNRY